MPALSVKQRRALAKVSSAMRHRDILHAGARRRQALGLTPEQDRAALVREFRRGTLYSGSGGRVQKKNQLRAILAQVHKGHIV